jgi:hypothetical protein
MVVDNDVKQVLGTIEDFCQLENRRLRRYQAEVARSAWDMILGRGGRSMAVILPRQSGKNELQAHIEAYLLLVCRKSTDAEIIKIAPTLKPQAIYSIRRLEKVLKTNRLAQKLGWKRENGMSIRMGDARITFLSGEPNANIVGATASLLLSIDEAQSISPEQYDTSMAPMAAAKNSARIFWGTAWTADTLLAREFRLADQGEVGERRRAFRTTAQQVGAEVPAYALFVRDQIKRLGRDHPAVRTQYFCEEIDAAGGLFPRSTLEKVQGDHAWEMRPRGDRLYAFLLDVGGEAAGGGAGHASLDHGTVPLTDHDATALVIVAVEPGGLPRYRVVNLRSWVGVGQPALAAALLELERLWRPRRVVVDATGLGQGLAAVLEQTLRGRVLRFTFSASSKSRLGWAFRTLVAGGRFLLPRADEPLLAQLREQMIRCEAEVGKGLEEPLRWGVPEHTRASNGDLLHDDLLVAAALCTQLDGESWPAAQETFVIRGRDPLREMDRL